MYNKEEMEGYKGLVTRLIYGKEVKGRVQEMLKAGDPAETLPQVTSFISDMAVDAFKRNRGVNPQVESVIGGSIIIASELMETGNVGGFFQVDKDQVPSLIKECTQQVIQKGIKKKYIDPVELQEVMQSGMPEEQVQMGMEMGAQRGLPPDANDTVAMEQYANQRVESALAQQVQQQAQPQPQAQGGQPNGIV